VKLAGALGRHRIGGKKFILRGGFAGIAGASLRLPGDGFIP
jgi:hypothetical protein